MSSDFSDIVVKSSVGPLAAVGLGVLYATYKEEDGWKTFWKTVGYSTGVFTICVAIGLAFKK